MIINDYDNLNALYVFEILNLEDPGELSIKSNLSISFKLKPFKKIYGKYVNLVNTLNQKTDLDNNAVYNYTQSFDFYSDENISDKFYFFSFKERPEKISDLFYSFNFDEAINPEDESNKVITISLKNADLLKELNNNFLTFEIVENWEKKEINKIKLRFKNYGLINEINFFGNIRDDNNNTFFSKIKPLRFDFTPQKYIFVPNFVHPILINNNNISLYSKFWEQVHFLNLKKIFQNIELTTNKINFLTFFESTYGALAYDAIMKCLWVNKILSSGFRGFSKEEIENFKAEVFSGNDQQVFIDKLLADLFGNMAGSGFVDELKKTRTIIMMLGEYLKSRFCWGGGLNIEHKLGLPFYFEVETLNPYKTFESFKNNTKFYLASNWFYLEQNILLPAKNTIFKNNIKQLDDYLLTLPFLPNKLEENNYTNSPVDFNTKNSQNFNYLTWAFIEKSKLINVFEKPQEIIDAQKLVQRSEVQKIFTNGRRISDYEAKNSNDIFSHFGETLFNFNKNKNENTEFYINKLAHFKTFKKYAESWLLKMAKIPRGYKLVENSVKVWSKNKESGEFLENDIVDGDTNDFYFYRRTHAAGVGRDREQSLFDFYLTYEVQKINELNSKEYNNFWLWDNSFEYFKKIFFENSSPENIELTLYFDKNSFFNIERIQYLEVKSFYLNSIDIAINDEEYKTHKLLFNDSPTMPTTIIKI